MTIKIDPEFQALIPPLGAEELQQLEANIEKDGCRDPLVVWGDILIDGHNRYEICTRLGIGFKTVAMQFESRVHARIWIRDNQMGRRNLTKAWGIELQLGNKDDWKAIGCDRKVDEGKKARAKQLGVVSDNDNTPSPKHSTRQEIAKAANTSTGMVGMAEQIKKKAPEVWEKAKSGEVSISTAYGEIRKDEKRARLEEKKAEIIQQSKGDTKENPPKVWLQDCVAFLGAQKPYSLLITDPPYSTDVEDIEAFARSWLPIALSKLKPEGRAYVFIGAYPKELKAYLDVAMPEQVLVWTYRNTLGPTPADNYKLNWQAILYYKGKAAKPLDCPVMVEQFSVQDVNAPDGRLGDRYHAWQKPIEIAERFIRHSTKPGDVVCDPFTCTGTFIVAASKLGRNGIGADTSRENLAIALERGCIYG